MRRALSFFTAVLGFATLLAMAPARADAIYDLKAYMPTTQTSGFIGVLGTVTLTEITSHQVHVHVDVSSSQSVIIDTGSHYAFAFNIGNLAAGQTFTVGGLSTGFTYQSSATGVKNSPYLGPFRDLIACANCTNGTGGFHPTSLDFNVTSTGGINIANFTKAGGYYFSTDISHGSAPNVQTGTVAANDFKTTTHVPEPAPIALLGLGLLALLTTRKLVRRRS